MGVVQNDVIQPLLASVKEKQEEEEDDENEDEEIDISRENSTEIQEPVTSIVTAYKLLTPSVKVWI